MKLTCIKAAAKEFRIGVGKSRRINVEKIKKKTIFGCPDTKKMFFSFEVVKSFKIFLEITSTPFSLAL